MDSGGARPFRWDVSDGTLADLRDRLGRARLLPATPARPRSALDQDHLRTLVDAWREFDWRAREAWLNGHPQVLVDLTDATIHAVHRRAHRADAPALLVLHGWPHTFALQLDFADLLPDFHVVVASLPGFAGSTAFHDGPFTAERVATVMHELMGRLGYDSYLTYGEDVSANVNDRLAAQSPESVAGIVVTHAHFPTPSERAALDDPAVEAFFERLGRDGPGMSGYAHLQGTRPDTLAAALNDSPVGLLAWITEKLAEWSDTPANEPWRVEERISRDRILTEATIYWVTQSIATSFRPYADPDPDAGAVPPVEVPAAVFIQRHEGDYPESAARAFYRDLRVFERLPEGGHFAIAEVPRRMARNVRDFARSLGLLG